MKILKHLLFSFVGGIVLILLSFNLLFLLNFPYVRYDNLVINSNILFLAFVFFVLSYLFAILYIRIYNFVAHKSFNIDFFSLSYFLAFLRVGIYYLLFAYLLNYYVYYKYIYYKLRGLFFFDIFVFLILIFMFFYEREQFAKKGREKKLLFVSIGFFFILFISLLNINFLGKTFNDLKLRTNTAKATKHLFISGKRRKIINLYVEGLSYDFIFPLIAEGKLPNFGWLIENGSWSRAKTLYPVNKWSALSSYITGVMPSKNLMYSFWKKSFTSSFVSAPYVLPNGFFFKTMESLGLIKKLFSKPKKYYKDDIFNYLNKFNIQNTKIFFLKEEKELFIKKNFSALPSPFDELELKNNILLKNFKNSVFLDEQRLSAFMQSLSKTDKKNLFYFLYLDGLLDTELRFYKYSFPEYYSSVTEESIHLYGGIIEKYYQYIDQYIGRILLNLKSSDLLIISSSFGVSPLDPLDQIINKIFKKEMYSAKISSSNEGVLILYGEGIKKNYILKDFSFLNVFPVITYYLQLPVPYNNNKNFSLKMFEKNFIRENPIVFSYERGER